MRKVLEMGYGGFPFGRSSNFDIASFSRKLPPETIYFGIDHPTRPDASMAHLSTMIALECVHALERECQIQRPRRVHLLRMDARQTRFSNAVFDEVHLHNVITDPRVTEGDVRSFVSEASRLLAPGGVFIASCEASCTGEARFTELQVHVLESGLENLGRAVFDGVTAFAEELSSLLNDRFCYHLVAKKGG